MDRDVAIQLTRFATGDLSALAFEERLYAATEDWSQIPEPALLALLASDYRSPESCLRARRTAAGACALEDVWGATLRALRDRHRRRIDELFRAVDAVPEIVSVCDCDDCRGATSFVAGLRWREIDRPAAQDLIKSMASLTSEAWKPFLLAIVSITLGEWADAYWLAWDFYSRLAERELQEAWRQRFTAPERVVLCEALQLAAIDADVVNDGIFEAAVPVLCSLAAGSNEH